ncbi:MAG: hypothetical protein LBP32_03455 [Spirochaetaceae bacterium]|nr:hypothetical protein [Spirochaetaceae bacterium]
MLKKSLMLIGLVFLLGALIMTGCPTGSDTDTPDGDSSGEDGSKDSNGNSSGDGVTEESTTDITDTESYKLKAAGNMNPFGVTATVKKGNTSGTITVTVTGNQVKNGLPTGVDNNNSIAFKTLNVTEATKLKFTAITIEGLKGGDRTIIKQTNNSLVLFKGASNYKEVSIFDPDDAGAIQVVGGTHIRQKTYLVADTPDSFDFTLLAAEGKGPARLEITPAGDTTKKYTVVIDFSGVKFEGDKTLDATDNTKKIEQPQSPGGGTFTDWNSPGIAIDETASKKNSIGGKEFYSFTLKSNAPVPSPKTQTDIADTSKFPSQMRTDFFGSDDDPAYTSLINQDNIALLNLGGVSAITIDLGINGDYDDSGTGSGDSAGNFTLRQENPAFRLYEVMLKSGATFTQASDASHYGRWESNINPTHKWDKSGADGGHIVYREKTDYVKADSQKFSILLWAGATEKVVTLTVTYPSTGASGPATKIIKIDYSKVQFTP